MQATGDWKEIAKGELPTIKPCRDDLYIPVSRDLLLRDSSGDLCIGYGYYNKDLDVWLFFDNFIHDSEPVENVVAWAEINKF